MEVGADKLRRGDGSDSGYSVGIDVGGTFTDVVLRHDASGAIFAHKELTSHNNPSEGASAGVRHVLRNAGVDARAVRRVFHATTLFTNALIERRGSKVGFVTTAGFRDIIEIGNERKFDLYDMGQRPPLPLVERALRVEVGERVLFDGTVKAALDEAELERAVDSLVDRGAESIAIGFLNAQANGRNEQAAAAFVRSRYPGRFVTASTEVCSQIGEYERFSTLVANAYVGSLASVYLDDLQAGLAGIGIEARLFLMASSGGLISIEEAKRRPITLLESGPAAGVIAAGYFGSAIGEERLFAFDMGGTTAKLGATENGKPLVTHHFEAARESRFTPGSGLPLLISTVDLIEIGAGGGSIAAPTELGLIGVGPRSAGSIPGPACYERGGAEPTVTDANLMLGYLNPDFFAGGSLKISARAAERAVEDLAAATGVEPMRAARGIREIVAEAMAGAARRYISERGYDARGAAMLVTGGGGPLHGCEVARKLGIDKVVCPPHAGVASAIGLIIAPAKVDRIASVGKTIDAVDWDRLEAMFRELERDAEHTISHTSDAAATIVRRSADMRYAGQGFEVVVDLPAGPYSPASKPAFVAAFETKYAEYFSRTVAQGVPEIVSIRIAVEAAMAGAPAAVETAAGEAAHAASSERRVHVGITGETVSALVIPRSTLRPDQSFAGPALVEDAASTLFVPPRAEAHVVANGTIVVELK